MRLRKKTTVRKSVGVSEVGHHKESRGLSNFKRNNKCKPTNAGECDHKHYLPAFTLFNNQIDLKKPYKFS